MFLTKHVLESPLNSTDPFEFVSVYVDGVCEDRQVVNPLNFRAKAGSLVIIGIVDDVPTIVAVQHE